MQVYKPGILDFFRNLSKKEGVGFLVLSKPTIHGFVKTACAYESNRAVVQSAELELLKYATSFEDYDDEVDEYGIYHIRNNMPIIHGGNLLVVKSGLVYSGEEVAKECEA